MIRKQCQITEERVRNSSSREELVWLYHELSRLHFDRKEFELSKAYATKCLREAYIIKDDKWIINAMFLMIKVHVVNRNKNGARIELRNCRKIALKIQDEKMEQFIGLVSSFFLTFGAIILPTFCSRRWWQIIVIISIYSLY